MTTTSTLQTMSPQQLAFAWNPRGGFSGDRAHRAYDSPEAACFGDKLYSRSPNALTVPNDGKVTLLLNSFKGQGDGTNLSGGTVKIVDFGLLQQKLGVRTLPQGDELKAAIEAHPECVLANVPVTKSGAIELSGLPKGAQIGVVATRDPGEPPYMARIATASDLEACRSAGANPTPPPFVSPVRPTQFDLIDDRYERKPRRREVE